MQKELLLAPEQKNGHAIEKPISISALEQFTAQLNQEPKKEWLQRTPDGKAEYIPVGIIENQLREQFMGLVQFETKWTKIHGNEYEVCATIKVFHPVIKDWLHYDGIGVKQVMVDAAPAELKEQDNDSYDEKMRKRRMRNEWALDLQNKKPNALEMNSPNAYAEAIKNAAKKIGKRFGADVNRKHEDFYQPIYTQEAEFGDDLDEIKRKLTNCKNLAELSLLWDSYEQFQKVESFQKLFNARKIQIKKQ